MRKMTFLCPRPCRYVLAYLAILVYVVVGSWFINNHKLNYGGLIAVGILIALAAWRRYAENNTTVDVTQEVGRR